MLLAVRRAVSSSWWHRVAQPAQTQGDRSTSPPTGPSQLGSAGLHSVVP